MQIKFQFIRANVGDLMGRLNTVTKIIAYAMEDQLIVS